MTREDKLYSMKMVDLVAVAEKLGIKINKKGAKSEAIEKILAAEEMNENNDKMIKKEEAENDTYVTEVMQQKKDLGIECPTIEHVDIVQSIDNTVLSKFVKKAQKMITQAAHDEDGYHITINANGKDIFYHDKNLQNIRAAIGHIYRGEVEV